MNKTILLDLDINCAGYHYKLWLEDRELEKDIRKNITVNLNGSEIIVESTADKGPDRIHFYKKYSDFYGYEFFQKSPFSALKS